MEAKSSQSGFNLIELLAVLAAATIVMSAGVPHLNSIIERNNISAEANRLTASINFARSQAVNNPTVVALERKSGTKQNWTEGWTVYSDAGGEGNEAINNGSHSSEDILLKDTEPSQSGLSVISDTGTDRWISFMPSGRPVNGPISIAICNPDFNDGINGTLITISAVGRIRRTTIKAADKVKNCAP